jgi:hypothetical protein
LKKQEAGSSTAEVGPVSQMSAVNKSEDSQLEQIVATVSTAKDYPVEASSDNIVEETGGSTAEVGSVSEIPAINNSEVSPVKASIDEICHVTQVDTPGTDGVEVSTADVVAVTLKNSEAPHKVVGSKLSMKKPVILKPNSTTVVSYQVSPKKL